MPVTFLRVAYIDTDGVTKYLPLRLSAEAVLRDQTFALEHIPKDDQWIQRWTFDNDGPSWKIPASN